MDSKSSECSERKPGVKSSSEVLSPLEADRCKARRVESETEMDGGMLLSVSDKLDLILTRLDKMDVKLSRIEELEKVVLCIKQKQAELGESIVMTDNEDFSEETRKARQKLIPKMQQLKLEKPGCCPFIAYPAVLKYRDSSGKEVEPMGKESDHIHIIAITNALGVGVRVEYMDRVSGNEVNHHDFPEGCQPNVTFLYRPGHYDILYPH
uniref:ubiquitinyl hydrolase 1 n=1 Tax=Saccoglossus kowalevskii TaxID=10224 RepID=A0ABM0MC41_SACKO|nr:PREDICTED: uncharacterized protein LOC102807319 [Saccoglossus kowalevskii]